MLKFDETPDSPPGLKEEDSPFNHAGGGLPATSFDSTPSSPVRQLQKPTAEPEVLDRSVGEMFGDFGISLTQGVVSAGEAAVGLGSLATGGEAGKYIADNIVDFGEINQTLQGYKSDYQQAAEQEVSDADGIWNIAKAALQNPTTIASAVAESLPLLVAGGVAGRLLSGGLKLLGTTAATASRVGAFSGEGIVAGGLAAEGIRSETEDQLLTGKQTGLALGTGAATSLFSFIGGKVADRLGIADPDIIASGGDVLAAAKKKGFTRAVVEGAFVEGVLEELPQSVQEQVLQNIALEKEDIWEGADQAAVMGTFAGMAMGAGVNAGKKAFGKRLTETTENPENDQIDDEEIELAQEELSKRERNLTKLAQRGTLNRKQQKNLERIREAKARLDERKLKPSEDLSPLRVIDQEMRQIEKTNERNGYVKKEDQERYEELRAQKDSLLAGIPGVGQQEEAVPQPETDDIDDGDGGGLPDLPAEIEAEMADLENKFDNGGLTPDEMERYDQLQATLFDQGDDEDLDGVGSDRRQEELYVDEDRRTGEDRRDNDLRNVRVSDMSQEDMKRALLEHDLTGIPNRRAYAEATDFTKNPSPVQVSIDADNLAWINDFMGHDAGDQMLQAIANELKAEIDEAFHVGGDEYLAQGEDLEAMVASLERVEKKLKDVIIEVELTNGTIITKEGLDITYGIDDTGNLQAADERLKETKVAKEKAGLRAARKEQPKGVTFTNPEGREDQVGQAEEEELAKTPTGQENQNAEEGLQEGQGNQEIEEPAATAADLSPVDKTVQKLKGEEKRGRTRSFFKLTIPSYENYIFMRDEGRGKKKPYIQIDADGNNKAVISKYIIDRIEMALDGGQFEDYQVQEALAQEIQAEEETQSTNDQQTQDDLEAAFDEAAEEVAADETETQAEESTNEEEKPEKKKRKTKAEKEAETAADKEAEYKADIQERIKKVVSYDNLDDAGTDLHNLILRVRGKYPQFEAAGDENLPMNEVFEAIGAKIGPEFDETGQFVLGQVFIKYRSMDAIPAAKRDLADQGRLKEKDTATAEEDTAPLTAEQEAAWFKDREGWKTFGKDLATRFSYPPIDTSWPKADDIPAHEPMLYKQPFTAENAPTRKKYVAALQKLNEELTSAVSGYNDLLNGGPDLLGSPVTLMAAEDQEVFRLKTLADRRKKIGNKRYEVEQLEGMFDALEPEFIKFEKEVAGRKKLPTTSKQEREMRDQFLADFDKKDKKPFNQRHVRNHLKATHTAYGAQNWRVVEHLFRNGIKSETAEIDKNRYNYTLSDGTTIEHPSFQYLRFLEQHGSELYATQTKAAEEQAAKNIFDSASALETVVALSGEYDQKGFTEKVQQLLVDELGRLAENADTDLTRNAFTALVADGKPVLPESFFESLYKKVRKEFDKAQKQNSRDPEVYQNALEAAMADKLIEGKKEKDAFKAGFDHALQGKTQSTIPQGEFVSVEGYRSGQEWVKTAEGKAWFDGKREKKQTGTGDALRRHWELNKKKLDELDGSDLKALWKALEKATMRADVFPIMLAEDATPGARAYLEAFRTKIATFKEFFYYDMESSKVRRGRYSSTPEEIFRSHLSVNPGAESVQSIKDLAEDYRNLMTEWAESFSGLKTVEEVGRVIGERLPRGDEKDFYITETEEYKNNKGLYLQNRYDLEYLHPGSLYSKFPRFLKEENVEKDRGGRKKPLKRPRLDAIVRTGLKDERKGKNVTAEDMKNKFGFADITIGNYVTSQQSQDHLNYAYDSFLTIAELLNMEPKLIGFGGKLHFAIGALGHGRAAAHFSPNHPKVDGSGTVPVINVTNTNGDGSVLHEYFHAIDYLTQDQELKTLINAMRKRLKKTPPTAAQAKVFADRFLAGGSYFPHIGRRKATKKDHALYALQHYYVGDRAASNTSFHSEALKLDGGNKQTPYWSNNVEPFARMAEAWGYDTLLEKGYQDDYVVSEWVSDGYATAPQYRGAPYPMGEERKVLVDLFSDFIDQIEWDENGPKLKADSRFNEVGLNEEQWKEYNDARKDLAENIDKYIADIDNKNTSNVANDEMDLFDGEEDHNDSPGENTTLDENDLDDLFDEAADELTEQEQEEPEADQGGAPRKQAWTKEDYAFLAEKVKSGRVILLSDRSLGLPTIHDMPGAEHLGVGLFQFQMNGKTFNFDGGSMMQATPSGQPYTIVTGAKAEDLKDLDFWNKEQILGILEPKAADKKTKSLDKEVEKTAGELAKEMAKFGVKGIDESLKGLTKLFGGGDGKLMSFPAGLDKETYEKAKPHFKAAAEAFNKAGLSFKDFVKLFFKALIKQFGVGIKPYAVQFAKEYQEEYSAQPDPNAEEDQVQDNTLVNFLTARADEITDNGKLKAAVAEYNNTKPADVTAEQMKFAQEAFEAVQVQRARRVVAEGQNDQEIYDNLLELYRSQPNLDVRSSTSIENQAYSTPAPIAYLASRMAGITQDAKVYEPTAGNGMLLLANRNAQSVANELEENRREQLQSLPFQVTGENAANWKPEGKFDAVIMNPPFGKLKDSAGKMAPVKYDGYTISSIDHLITAKGLEAMADDGKAAIIIGASKKAGEIPGPDRTFFNWLYSNYNVTEHFEVDGDLYKRQGAAWPIRVIIVSGRVKSQTFSPKTGTIERVQTWEELYERYTKSMDAERPGGTGETGVRDGADNETQSGPPDTTNVDGVEADQTDQGSRGTGEGPTATGGGSVSRPGVSDTDVGGNTGTDSIGNGDVGQDQQPAGESGLDQQQQTEQGSGESDAGADAGNLPGRSERRTVAKKGSEYQTEYLSRSTGFNEAVLTPSNMTEATSDFLDDLEAKVGSVDAYVAEKLGYDSVENLHESFMGLQVDAVAAAINNIEGGKGTIIADQTGVGKGRQAAAILRYAKRVGKTPVFVTVKDNLFSDMYGDLLDIGSDDFKPFIMNTDGVVKHNGKILFKNKSAKQRKMALQQMMSSGKLPGDSNALFLTYSQINKQNDQRLALSAVADNAIFVLDESHNVAGEREKIKKVNGNKEIVRTGAGYMFDLLEDKPVVYLSATYAKRPDNMPVYYRTDISEAVDNIDDLVTAVEAGGNPLQTVISGMLARSGQLFRRERSFDGISIKTVVDTDNKESHAVLADEVTTGLRAIVQADTVFHNVFVEQANENAEEYGGTATGSGNKASSSIDHQNFTSVLHNYVSQLLMALKAEKAANDAIAQHKSGAKPVLALENTMESFLKQWAEGTGAKPGDPVTIDFRDVLSRALMRSRRLLVQQANGDKEPVQVELDELDPITRRAYDDAQEIIDALDVKDLPVSPIDYMRQKMADAGMNVSEITGRDLVVDYSGKFPVLAKRKPKEIKDRRATVDGFNSGDIDALVLNAAGSTGLSIHASERYTDQKPRHMTVVQASGDINILMQMLGRINRTGQVQLPQYTMMGIDIPAEKRPLARTAMKMKTLNANTSANTKSDTSVTATDMLNRYGDKIVAEYLLENPEMATQLSMQVPQPDQSGNVTAPDGYALKMTGRMALLPVETQRQIYEEIESAYESLIDYLNATGQNDLEPRTVDLNAKIVESRVVYEGKDPKSIFGGNTTVHKVRSDVQGNPPSADDVRTALKEALDGKSSEEKTKELVEQIQKNASDTVAELNKQKAQAQKDLEKAQKKGDEKEIAEADAAMNKIQARMNTLNGQFQTIGRNLDTFSIGSRVALDLGEGRVRGVVVGQKTTHKEGAKGNPLALSKTRITFMVNTGVRKVELPLSQLQPGKEIFLEKMYDQTSEAGLDDIFKPLQAETDGGKPRETRYIATGNLIAGAAEFEKGRVISFTDEQGKIHQGILLPKNYKERDFDTAGTNRFALRGVKETVKFLIDNRLQIPAIFDADKDIYVRNTGGDRWSIQVPRANTKQIAVAVKFNPELRELVGDFYSRGKAMTAEFDVSKLPKAIEILMNITTLYAPASNRDAYVAAGGKAQAEADGFDKKNTSLSLSPGVNVNGMTVAPVRRVANRVLAKKKGSWGNIDLQVSDSFASLPNEVKKAVQQKYGDDPNPKGVLHGDSVYIIADQHVSETDVEQTILHEIKGHVGIYKLFGKNITRKMNDLYDSVGGFDGLRDIVRKREISQEVSEYIRLLDAAEDLTDEQKVSTIMLEVFALTAEKERTFDRFKTFIGAIRSWLRNNGFMKLATLGETDLLYSLARGEKSIGRSQQNVGQVTNLSLRPFGGAGATQRAVQAVRDTKPKIADAVDYLRMKFQDKFVPLLNLQKVLEEEGWVKTTENDAYKAEERFHGKAAKRLEDMYKNDVSPLIEEIKSSTVSLEELEDYMYAKYAPQRNAYIASINPKYPDGGSGMKNAEARRIEARFDREGKTAELERLAQKAYAIARIQRDVIRNEGLEFDETVDAWELGNDRYIPLRGGGKEESTGRNIGTGTSVRGSGTKRALGRSSKATDLLAHLFEQVGTTIVRAEKAKVGRAFLQMVEQNQDETRFKIYDPKNKATMPTTRKIVDNPVVKRLKRKISRRKYALKRVTDEQELQTLREEIALFERQLENENARVVKDIINPGLLNEDNIYSVTRENGSIVHIEIMDKDLARAMKNITTNQHGKFVRAMAMTTRYLARMSTSLSPEFLITNFERDIQTALVHLVGEKKAGIQSNRKLAKEVLKGIPGAMRGIKRVLRNNDTESEWAQWFERFQNAGAKVSFMDLQGVEQWQSRLKSLSDGEGFIDRSIDNARKLGDLVGDYNSVFENAVRLSSFRKAIELGMSEEDATSLAKNLTVNFNRKGELGPAMNAFYMFANAGVQGSARIIEALVKSPRVRKMMGSVVVMAWGLAELARFMGGDDDDDKAYFDKLPDYTKQNNLIFMGEGGEVYKIRLPYGYNVFVAAGYALSDMFHGKSPVEAAGFMTSAVLNSFNPLGGDEGVLKTLSPTVMDPFVELATNENFMGTQIMPENLGFGPDKPDSQLYYRNASTVSRQVTEKLNELFGGTKWKSSGVMDISPETIDHLVAFSFGGVGRTIGRLVDIPGKASDGDLTIRDVPFLRQIHESPLPYVDFEAFYDNIDKVESASAAYKEMPVGDKAAFVRDNPEVRLRKVAASYRRRLSAQRKKYYLLKDRGQHAQARQVQKQMQQIAKSFNRRFNAFD